MELRQRFHRFRDAVRTSKNDLALSILLDLDLQTVHRQLKTTPLHMSAAWGNKIITEHLIKSGCRVDVTDIDGNTPFVLAINFEHHEVAKLLTDSGANFNVLNVHGSRSPVFYASLVSSRQLMMQMVKLAVTAGKVERPKAMGQIMDAKHYRVCSNVNIRFLFDDVDSGRQHFMYGTGSEIPYDVASRKRSLKQLALLEAEGAFVADCFYEGTRRFLYEYYVQCKKELQVTSSTKFLGSVTLFHVLSRSNRKLVFSARSASLVKAFKSADVGTNFPEYSEALISQFDKWVERTKLTRSAAMLMACIHPILTCERSLPYFDCDNPVVFKILGYLTMSELQLLCKSFKLDGPLRSCIILNSFLL